MTIAPRPTSTVLPVALIAVAVFAAYANTFSVPFVFDDLAAVTQNPSIEHFLTALNPPAGLSVTGRPLVNLTLALNYALSGHGVWSYHALNLSLHLACALALFALVRHTLTRTAGSSDSVASDPAAIALSATLLWSLHPLQTSAVTYIMQRSEVLVSLCYVLTLYALVRGAPAPTGTVSTASAQARRAWLTGSVLACAGGMATKEVMVTAPLLALLYDRLFLAGTFRAALRGRTIYYGALAGTWGILAALTLGSDNRGASAGFDAGMAWTDYALTQAYAVAHYLRLAVWPSPLVFDYGTNLVTEPARVIGGGLVLALLAAGTLLALRRWPRAGFCGVAFFALLAPSSSLVPVATQTMAEHRIYLALAAPLVVVVAAGRKWFGRRSHGVALMLAVVCGGGTLARNLDYASVVRLWGKTVAQQPANARAHYNYGLALWEGGDPRRALPQFAATVELEPNHRAARKKLAIVLLQSGRTAEALDQFRTILQAEPNSAVAHYDVTVPLILLGRPAEALPSFSESIRLDPAQPIVRYNFGKALAELGRYADALVQFEEAARLDPTDASARNNATRIREYLGK